MGVQIYLKKDTFPTKGGYKMEQNLCSTPNELVVDLAYIRVSTKDQNLDRQKESILQAVPNLKLQYLYEDKYTGKSFNRPEYVRLKQKVEELRNLSPDIKLRLTVHELDRIGRDYKEIKNEVNWFRSEGVQLRFLDIPEEIINEQMGITGELLLDIIICLKSYWAEQELVVKQKRTAEGIAKAHERGVVFGRKAIVVDESAFRKVAERAVNKQISHREAMKLLELKDYVYWKHIKKFFPEYRGSHSR